MLEDTDKNIINELSKNGRITMKELGEKVHLTGQAASSRVLKLEEKRYSINIKKRELLMKFSLAAPSSLFHLSILRRPRSLDKQSMDFSVYYRLFI